MTVNVTNNRVFDNGVTTKNSGTEEGRQDAGGLTINTGHAVSNVYLKNNKVVADEEGDFAYQCFGTCNLTGGSGNNLECGGSHSNKLGDAGWKTSGCDAERASDAEIRAQYPESHVPRGTQFTDWL